MIELVGSLGWIAISASAFAGSTPEAVVPNIPLYGLFQTEVISSAAYDNPFAVCKQKKVRGEMGHFFVERTRKKRRTSHLFPTQYPPPHLNRNNTINFPVVGYNGRMVALSGNWEE